MGKESHYSSKKDRVFVRGIQGQYSLKDELARLRGLPRVIKGKDLLFNDEPQSFSKHFIEPVDGMTQTLHVHGNAAPRPHAEARPRERVPRSTY
jgi:hypothetical protein